MRVGFATLLIFVLVLAYAVAVLADFYDDLEVSRDATQEEIKRNYRRLSVKLHPDKNSGNEAALRKFNQVKKAYEVLSDPDKRQTYDIEGEEGLEREGRPQQQWNPFANFFGGGQVQEGGKPKGSNMLADHLVSLEELYLGSEVKIKVQKNQICSKCRGTGGKDGKLSKCSACGGQGSRLMTQQLAPGFNVQVNQPCSVCSGTGKTAAQKCPVCGGAKVSRVEKSLTLIIERGMPDGYEAKFEREADQAPGTVPGDVIIKVSTRPHHTFERKNDDLHHSITLSLKEALTGFKKTIIHLDKRSIPVESDSVVSHGEVRVIKNEGMPKHEFPSEKGNLYVKFAVRMPTILTEDQKVLIKELLGADAA